MLLPNLLTLAEIEMTDPNTAPAATAITTMTRRPTGRPIHVGSIRAQVCYPFCYPTNWDDAEYAGTIGARARKFPKHFRTQRANSVPDETAIPEFQDWCLKPLGHPSIFLGFQGLIAGSS